MKRIVLLVVCLLVTGGVFAATPTDTVAEPMEQASATVDAAQPVQVETATEVMSCEMNETKQPFEAAKTCPGGYPSCSPFHPEVCDAVCGAGFGVCYRFCCVCAG